MTLVSGVQGARPGLRWGKRERLGCRAPLCGKEGEPKATNHKATMTELVEFLDPFYAAIVFAIALIVR